MSDLNISYYALPLFTACAIAVPATITNGNMKNVPLDAVHNLHVAVVSAD